MSAPINHAMVLAAGLGTRMRARAEDPPKPLTEIAGRTLLDRLLDRLEHAGMTRIVINLHHKAERISDHLAQRDGAEIVYSDERTELLETGGGVKKALPLLGPDPFLVCNGDILWQENADILAALRAGFDAARMDALLMLAPLSACTGYNGQGDFDQHADGRLTRRQGEQAPFVFGGVQVLSPAAFDATPNGAFSLNHIYDSAAATGRLYGEVLDGRWMHVGTPEGVHAAQEVLASGLSN